MALLRSYVGGQWVTPEGDGRPVFDAVSGDEVARISSAGIGMAAALAYGRSVGGPALRELTFHQRAGLLKALGSYLREHRDELYATVGANGCHPRRREVRRRWRHRRAARLRQQGAARAA